MVMEVSDEEAKNAAFPIVVTRDGMVRAVKLSQAMANDPMAVRLDGNIRLVIELLQVFDDLK